MIVLGLDTATPQVGCALGDDDGPVASFHLARGRRHAETLIPAVDYLCRQSGVDLASVGGIAVDVGPGLFTGLRVGVATGKALAAALGVPMTGLVSLDILAHPHRRTGRLIASVVDARRGEVFWAWYRPVPVGPRPDAPGRSDGSDRSDGPGGSDGHGQHGGMQRITDYRVTRPEELAGELLAIGEDTLAVGDGALRYAGTLAALHHVEIAEPACGYPSAAVLVELAQPRAGGKEFVSPDEVEPLYLRQADVRINWEERDHRSADVSTRQAASSRP